MKTRLLLLPMALLLSGLSLAQTNYNAGVDSGTGGTFNVFIGPQAGRITTGNRNSFLGIRAGFANTTGQLNAFLGSYAGLANTIGRENSFLGSYAGFANTTGYYNSFVGALAGYTNTTGIQNSFLGFRAGFANTTGYNNSFVGARAGYTNTTGSFNSFLGNDAGGSNTTGSYNNFLGNRAGYTNTTGSENNFLGPDAGYANTTGNYNSFVGSETGFANTTGNYNSFLGYQAGASNTTGSGLTLLGNLANPADALTNATAIGDRAYVAASNALVLGSISEVNGAEASTNVGLGPSAPGYRLHLNAEDAAKVGGGTWVVASDRRLKKDIGSFTDGLQVLLKIKPLTFRYNGKAGIKTEKQFVGVVAQEMQQIAPYTVGEFTYRDSTGQTEKYLDYDANAVTYVLINSVKELNEVQQQQLREKDAQIAALEARLARLEALSAKQPFEKVSPAKLWQNQPNPYHQTTIIKYSLPENTTSAQLKVFSVTGQEVYRQELTGTGTGEVQLSGQRFSAGTYIYHLLVNGRSVDSKKLVLTH